MNAKELLDKYIKYNSKITFDIFKLMYQKLIDLGFTTPHEVENAFKEFSGKYRYFVMKVYDDKLYFNQFGSRGPRSEISVEDLLGYNPFESFILPEKWYVKVTGDSINYPELAKWRGPWCHSGISYVKSDIYWTAKFPEDFIEITLEQFKHYVLKEPIITETISESKVEEFVPEYVECFYSDTDAFIINKIYKCEPLSSPINLSLNSETGLKNSLPYEGNLWKFKPSTKEAFEAQNKPQSIEKWEKGSYVVCVQDYSTHFKVGDIGQIENVNSYKNNYIDISKSVGKACLPFKANCKWFATLAEAEEFSKTLVKSVECKECKCTNESSVDKPKQLLKQVVHCKTQEEWDFVLSKLRSTCLLSKQSEKFEEYIEENPSGIAVNTVNCEWSDLEWWEEEGYQILSFQEWCDLNGYKMEKTRFKKGDYVVSLRPERLSTYNIKSNYCYIQYKDGDRISVDNGVTMFETDFNYARLATPEEIAEYKRVGKPYDVTTLQTSEICTYGLNVGDFLDVNIINDWGWLDNNKCYVSSEDKSWKKFQGVFMGNRTIQSFKLIDGIVGFLISDTNNVYLRAEGFKEFADNYYTENTSNFKVGSWYKYNGYYLKYSKTDDRNIFIASEYINTEDNSFKDDLIDFTCGIADGSKKLVTNLSVIQQYLPEGHPDLFNTLNKEAEYISETFKTRVTSREVKRINI